MEVLRDLDDGVSAICGGMCSCATCHVFIHPDWMGKLAAPDELELIEGLTHAARMKGPQEALFGQYRPGQLYGWGNVSVHS